MSNKSTQRTKKLEDCKTMEDLMGKDGLIKNLLAGAIENILKAELDVHLGYKKHEAKGKRSGDSRNGFSHKKVQTTLGEVELEIPRDRNGSFEPKLLPKHTTNISIFDEKIISMYAKGMSTRDIQSHIKEIYGAEVSPAIVSMITDKVTPLVESWRNRALLAIYAILYFDAIFIFVHEGDKVVKKAVYICIGIDMQGNKDVLGLWLEEEESATFWRAVCENLKTRGVTKVLISCFDGLKGLPTAIKEAFPGVRVQLCTIHMIRNSLKYVEHKDKKTFMANLKDVYQAVDEPAALKALDALKTKWQKEYPKAVKP